MIDKILPLLLMAFFFGFCVFIHEFGHLLAGMWRKLHIERFSVGFGPVLKKWTIHGIEFCISSIPFGGYVALPQLEPTDEPATTDGKPLPHAKPSDRILVAFAGPLFNVFFGLFLAVIVWQVGYERLKQTRTFMVGHVPETYQTEAGETKPTPEYEAGLRAGDEVTAVNGTPLQNGWDQAREAILLAPDNTVTLTYIRDGEEHRTSYSPVPNPNYPRDIPMPFIMPEMPGQTIAQKVTPGSAAAAAGLKEGDMILAVDGVPVKGAGWLKAHLDKKKPKAVDLKIKRGDKTLMITDLTPKPIMIEGKERLLYGIMSGTKPEMEMYYPTPLDQVKRLLVLTGSTVSRLFDSKSHIKAKHMSGPVGIGRGMYQTFASDFIIGLQFVAFISFSLAIFNLLPLPILDGGHIVLAALEGLTSKRVPARVVQPIFYIFFAILIAFALYVTVYDVMDFLPDKPQEQVDGKQKTPTEKAPAPATETRAIPGESDGDAPESDASGTQTAPPAAADQP